MTPPDVSDAAVEAARVAYGNSMPDQERMRAAIAAAVPHLLEQIGFTNSEEYRELKAGRGGWVSGLELDGDTVTLYRLRTQENADVPNL